MSPNRFNLEDAISAVRLVEDDLEMLCKYLLDWPNQKLDEDALHNMVFGIQNVAKLRNENLWQVFKQEFKLDEYFDGELNLTGYDEFFAEDYITDDLDDENPEDTEDSDEDPLPIPKFLREDAA